MTSSFREPLAFLEFFDKDFSQRFEESSVAVKLKIILLILQHLFATIALVNWRFCFSEMESIHTNILEISEILVAEVIGVDLQTYYNEDAFRMSRPCQNICHRKNDVRIVEAGNGHEDAFLSAYYQRFASVKTEYAGDREAASRSNCKFTVSLLRSSEPRISEGECNEWRVERRGAIECLQLSGRA